MDPIQEKIRPEFMLEKYTEYDPLDLKVIQNGKEIKLMTYRYAVPDGLQKKGITLQMTGYGFYCEFHAYFLKLYAQRGYECFALDLRGFGNSEGTIGYIESSETIYKDIETFIQSIISKYSVDTAVTPIFIMGTSFAGLQSFNYTIKNPGVIKAMTLVVPFFGLYKPIPRVARWLINTVNYIRPSATLTLINPTNEEAHKHPYYYQDPKIVRTGTIRTLAIFEEMQNFARQNAQNAKTPFLLLTGDKDDVVCNQTAIDIQNATGNPLNQYFNFLESDHVGIGDNYEIMIKKGADYFDFILEQGATNH